MLRGGQGHRVIVAFVNGIGKAHRCGVAAGDILISIDGRRICTDLSAEQIQSCIRPPTILVFMGFVGKLKAEVRLNHRVPSCGVSDGKPFQWGSAPVQISDQVVFRPNAASLFLATQHEERHRQASQANYHAGICVDDDGSLVEDCNTTLQERVEDLPQSRCFEMYEIRHEEARSVVQRALSRALSRCKHEAQESANAADSQDPASSDPDCQDLVSTANL